MDHLLCHADAVDLTSAPQLAFSQWPSLLVICMGIILFHSVPEACLIQPLLQFGLQVLLCLQAWLKAKLLLSLPLEGSLGDRESNF